MASGAADYNRCFCFLFNCQGTLESRFTEALHLIAVGEVVLYTPGEKISEFLLCVPDVLTNIRLCDSKCS